MTANPVVLKNKGIPVKAYVIEQDPRTGAWNRKETGDEDHPWAIADFWVRMDNNVLADLEDEFGSLDGFEEAMQKRTSVGIRAAFCSILGFELNREGKVAAGLKIIEGEQANYATALGAAMSLANGVDPMQAAEMLEVGFAAVKKAMKDRTESIAKDIANAKKNAAEAEENDSPGKNGAEPGSDLVEASSTP